MVIISAEVCNWKKGDYAATRANFVARKLQLYRQHGTFVVWNLFLAHGHQGECCYGKNQFSVSFYKLLMLSDKNRTLFSLSFCLDTTASTTSFSNFLNKALMGKPIMHSARALFLTFLAHEKSKRNSTF